MRLALLGLLALAACSGKDEGTTISFNTDDGGGNIVASSGGSRASINIPGFSGSIKLPRIAVKADQVDLNGVHLYPGSTVTGMNIDARNDNDGDDGKGTVRISFDSPADPAAVRDWFAPRLKDAGFTLRADGAGLSGKTDDDKPFSLTLTPDGHGKAKGTIVTG